MLLQRIGGSVSPTSHQTRLLVFMVDSVRVLCHFKRLVFDSWILDSEAIMSEVVVRLVSQHSLVGRQMTLFTTLPSSSYIGIFLSLYTCNILS